MLLEFNRISELLRAFLRSEEGNVSIEYGMIAGGISAAGIAAVMGLGTSISGKMQAVADALNDIPDVGPNFWPTR